MNKCSQCGGELMLLTGRSALEHFVCSACKRDFWAVVEPPLPAPSAEDTRLVRVFVRWAGERPSKAEMLSLKHFLPEFWELSMAEVLKRSRGVAAWPLGIHPHSHARCLQEDAEQLGLLVAIEEIDGTGPNGREDR